MTTRQICSYDDMKRRTASWYDDVTKCKHLPRNWPFVGESTGNRWIPLTNASYTKLWCLLWSVPEQTAKQAIETPVIWDDMALIMASLLWD